MLRITALITLIITLFCISSCALIPVYKPTIQQGNVYSPEMVFKIKVGMTEAQVRFIMGSPVLVNTFSTYRWDYVYTLLMKGKPREVKHVTVVFQNGRVVGVR